jgi:hypothetical protein
VPLKQLLEDSLYYPCSHVDFHPIKEFRKLVVSFVYADLLLSLSEHKRLVKDGLKREYNTSGEETYVLIREREIPYDQILPHDFTHDEIYPTLPDIDASAINEFIQWIWWAPRPYVYWTIWKRVQLSNSNYEGPEYFSLLYIQSEMNKVYQRLYTRLNIKPKVLYLHNPGMGFWDMREDKRSSDNNTYYLHYFFEKVLEKNPAGLPEYLFSDEHGTRLQKKYEYINWSPLGGIYKLRKLNLLLLLLEKELNNKRN